MSDQSPGGADYPNSKRAPDGYPEAMAEEFGSDDPGRSRWPFMVALGFVVLLVAGIAGVALIDPPAERLSDSAQVQHAVNDAFTARNSLNYEQYREAHCEADRQAADFPTAAEFADENRAARTEHGQIVIPDMAVEMQGDVAAVQVNWHREDTPDEKQTTDLTVIRQGDEWKVCNA
ncbi:hypothetical protein MUG78_08165 [Gordonia alkaliphila]|uniref:Rv0361 family membrane protein n=1 Tax=Gordonia alkaliphila TaxID=1053547 RepID=UPI001FF1ABF4|nr:hypothetical protein [Gordonia alkaliphila]MCK0439434.1 hypothetical protein [Gordonia alkaliphila]